MRRLTGLALLLALASPSQAQDLCGQLIIPRQLGLACASAAEPGTVEVTPVAGTFALLSRLTVRPLERAGADAEAWTDPSGWLRAQMTPDTSRLSESLGDWPRIRTAPSAAIRRRRRSKA